jgi:hypothetical protein
MGGESFRYVCSRRIEYAHSHCIIKMCALYDWHVDTYQFAVYVELEQFSTF